MELKFYSQILRCFFSARKSLLLLVMSVFFMGSQVAQAQLSGLAFDGTDDNVSIPVDPSLNISSAITIEAWVYIAKPNPLKKHTQNIVSKANRADNTGYIFPRSDDEWQTMQFLLYINGYGWQALSVPYGASYLNQWHHLAATFDGANMNIYIDGVLAGTKAFAGSILTNNNNLTIGDHPGDDEHFLGSIDELRIWNRALNQCEIGNNMNCELVLPQNGLAAYYQFNPVLLPVPQLTLLKDLTANGNDGTLNNFSLTGTLSNWVSGHISSGSCTVFTPVIATATSSASAVPVNGTINLFATGGSAYSWVGPNGFTSTQQNPVINNVNTSAGGTYTVTVTSNGCSATASVVVQVANKATGLNFDGVDDYISIPRSSTLNIGNTGKNFSIETWVKPMNSLPAVQSVVTDASYAKNDGFVFPRTDDGWSSFTFWLKINGVWKGVSAPMPVGAIGTWQHLAATYDGFFMRIYLNGILANTLAVTGTITASTNPITIGTQISPNAENFNGSIDELRFWNRTLTQCEISSTMSCELFGGYDANLNGIGSQTALSAYYRFNQGLNSIDNTSFNTLADSSLNGNNGTMYNFARTGNSSNWVSGIASGNCAVYNAPPAATITSNGPVVEIGTPLTLTATGGTSYSWTGPNGFTANTASVTIPSAQLNQSGTYSVSVIGSGCTQVLSVKINVAYRAGILDFDGVNDFVTVPNSSSLNIANQITLESWVYATDAGRNTQDVMGKSTKDNNSGYIFPRTDDGWQNCIFYLQINGVWQTLNAPYPGLNQWHHLAATYDGFYMRIYVDGIAKASKQVIGTITENTNNLTFGQQPGYDDEYFKGQVDEAKIWNRALNQCEIINNMNCEMDPAAQHGLAAYYRFNQAFEGQDNPNETTLTDLSNNSNNGTLENFALSGTNSNWGKSNITGACQPYTLPDIVASANGTIFGVGSVVKLNATGAINGAPYNWDGPNSFISSLQSPNILNAQTSNSGVYTVTVPYVKCSITASTGVSVITGNLITADGPTTICPSSAVTLNAPNNSGVTYKWYLNDVLIPTATGATYAASQTGTYTVSEDNGHDIIVSVPISVTVVDDQAPVPDMATLPVLNLATPGEITTIPTATDNCRGTIQGVPNIPLATYNTPGTYSITWTYDDQNGHVVTQDQQIVVVLGVDIVPPVLTVPSNITLNANTTDCGAVASFTATATDNSGLPVTITYSQNPGTVFNVGVNTVTVTATDQSGNHDQKTFTVTVQPTVVAPITGNSAICTGATTTLSSTTVGGTWSSANPAIATVNASGLVTGVAAGTANILYTNACGVYVSKAITVNALPAATVSAGSATTFCTGGSVNLSVATQTGNTYQWYNGSTAIESAQANTYAATTSGVYAVVVTNSNGCKSTSAATSVTVNPLPTAVITEGATAAFCTGSSVTLHTAAQSGVTYQWYKESVAITNANTSSYTATTPGNYSLVVTNASGCQSTSGTTVVTENALPVAAITASSSINLCTGGSVFLVGTGQTGNTYQWYKNGNLITDAIGSAYLAVDAGDYTVEITNVNGCKAVSAPATVTLNSLPVASITAASATTFCSGGSVVINATAQTGYTYQWYNGSNAIASATESSYTATASGNYSVVVSNQGGCQASSNSIAVTVNPLPVASVTAASATTFCSGGSVVINATAQAGNTYQWYNGANAIASATGSSYTATTSGNYSVLVSSQGGCQAGSNSIAVTVNQLPVASITAASATTFCSGGSVVINATAQAGYTYQWYNGSNAIASATESSYTATASGNYSVVVSNQGGCQTSSNSITVTVNPLPVASVTAASATTFCSGGSVVINATAQAGNTYQWYNGANAIASATGSSYTTTTSGNYSVLVSSQGGCQAGSNSIAVTVNPLPVANVTAGSATSFCVGGSVSLSTPTQAGYTYQWYNGTNAISSATSSTYTATTTGNYAVVVKNTSGCQASSTATAVTVNALPTVSPITGNTSVNTGAATQLADATSGGVWSSNSANATVNASGLVTGVSAGTATITYTVTNASGCATSVSTVITVSTQPVCTAPVFSGINNITLNASNGQCSAAATYTTTVTATGTPALTYTLTGATVKAGTGNGSGNVFNTGVTNVTVTATNACGSATTHFTVTVKDVTGPVPTVTTLPTISGQCTVSIVIASGTSHDGDDDHDGHHHGDKDDKDHKDGKGKDDHKDDKGKDDHKNDKEGNKYGWNNKYEKDDHRGRDDDKDHKNEHDSKGNKYGWNGKDDHDNRGGKDDHHDNDDHGQIDCTNGSVQITAPTASDNCTAGLIIGTTTDPLTYSTKGTYQIHWKFDDGKGNITIQTQTVIVKDDEAPVPTQSSLSTIKGTCSVTVTSRPTAQDGCKGTITGTTTDPLSYSGSGTYVIHWTYDDGNGNQSYQNQTVIITDDTRPVISDIRDVTVSCAGSVDPSITGTPTAYDNCSAVTVTYSDNVTGNGSYITRTWKATDASGNYSTSTQKITINDNVKPVIADLMDVTVGCSGSTDPSSTGTPTATDNCSGVVVTYSDKVSGNKITRTWKATDASGNYSTSTQVITMGVSFTVTVSSVPTSSTYTGGEPNNLYLGYGAQSTSLQLGSLPSSGAPYTYQWSGAYTNRLSNTNSASPVFTPATYGYYTFSVLVTNKYGCTSTATISICVTDIRVPGTNGAKVYVCHTPVSYWWWLPSKPQTLEVPVSQVSSHIGTGYAGCGSSSSDRLGSCDQTPCNTTSANTIVSTNSSTVTKETGDVVTSEEELKVTVMPNPSTTYFTLKFESKYQTPVNLRVMDASGRMIDAKSKLGPNSTVQIGANYASGTYYAEITQGGLRKMVQLIKSR